MIIILPSRLFYFFLVTFSLLFYLCFVRFACFSCKFIYTWTRLESTILLFPRTFHSLPTQHQCIKLTPSCIWSIFCFLNKPVSWTRHGNHACVKGQVDDSNRPYVRPYQWDDIILLAWRFWSVRRKSYGRFYSHIKYDQRICTWSQCHSYLKCL